MSDEAAEKAALPMTVISADHTIYQPPIFKSLTGISADRTINESALITGLQI